MYTECSDGRVWLYESWRHMLEAPRGAQFLIEHTGIMNRQSQAPHDNQHKNNSENNMTPQ